MAKIQAFSSVSVVDLTDVGSINLYCTSNQPLSVIYDPNANNGSGSYTPNWSTSNLKITPVISYNGKTLSLTAQGVSFTYTRKEGSGTAVALTSGETVSKGVLTVNANKMASVTSGQLTYICKLVYTDPNTGVPLTTEASLTYTLVTQATQIKDVDIVGETAFLYNADRSVVGSGTITLRALLSNVSMAQWQYQKSDGTYEAYPITTKYNTSITGTELVVGADEANIWLQGDRYAVIKVTTNDSDIYDTIQINKILDGVAGDAVVSAVLTNESFLLPVNSNGNPISDNVWSAGATTIKIFEGGDDVTSQWSVTANRSDGLSGTYNSTTHTFTPSGLTSDVGYVNFVCTRTNYSEVVKRYTITKQYAGANGENAVIYTVEPNYYALNRAENNTLTPSAVTFNAYKKTGADLTKTTYSGRFIIAETTNGSSYTNKYTSSKDESSKSYTPSANTVIGIKCTLYASGGTSTELDNQSIVITKDGKTGNSGANGNNGVSMWLSNYSDVIPCTTAKKATAQKDISIPFSAYQGITRVPVTATVGTLPTGVTVQSNTAGTANASGLLVLRVAKDATFMTDVNVLTGDITITLTATIKDANTGASSTTSTDQKYTWTKNVQASNGTSAVILQLYSEDGGIVSTTKATTTIKTLLTSGTSTVTPSAVTWAKFSGTGYTTIDGETGTSIVINASDVEDQMWLRCQATYSSKTYTAYYTIDDVSDPYVAYTFATVEQFKNSQGFGAIYTRVYQNGEEVDPIKSTVFSNTAPTGASNGDFYYYLDKSKKTCTLKKYNGTSWADATEKDTLTYKYYRLDNSGNAIDTTSAYKDTRCFYIDPSMINGRMQFICDVTG
jgi:hypothetical protein